MSGEIGVGMIGYEFMGRAHSAALHRLPMLPSPPALIPRLVALGGAQRGARRGGGQAPRMGAPHHRLARADRRRGDRSARQRRAQRRARRAQHRGRGGGQARDLREAARARRRREPRDLAPGRGRRRGAHVRLQLPLRPRRAPRAGDAGGGRARRDPSLPRALPPVLGRRPGGRGRLALRPADRGLGGARRPRHTRHRPRALPGRRARDRRRRRRRPSSRAAGSTTPSPPPSSSRAGRSGPWRRRASRRAGSTRWPGRSTARAAPSLSTWSA